MALETKLVQKLSQNLLMTPQLQQAIKLLQLGRLEYKEAIEKELLENPILEEIKEEEDSTHRKDETTVQENPVQQDLFEEETSAPQQEPKIDWEDYLESFTDVRGSATPKGLHDHEDKPSLEATLAHEESLTDYLFSQIRLLDITQHDQMIAMHLIGNLDKNGYLCLSYEDLSEQCGCTINDIERIAERLTTLEPAGICARNLQECLLIQLERLGKGNDLEGRIVLHHLDRLQKRKYDQIAKIEGVTLQNVYDAISTIKNLDPRPGRLFSEETVRYIIPDIYVQKVAGEYVVTLNEDGLPKLRVSPYYLTLLKGDDKNSEQRNYLQDRLKAASWLIKSIHQRQQTIFRVTESIVKFQRSFLDNGIARLKPLVLKEVADDIGMHESTVSRVTTNKYVHTPQGIFELKYFFTTGIKTASGSVSSSSVKERIRALINEEDPANPISDQQLVEILVSENIQIARRTIAKYRESLNIPSSSKRKKLF
jgi:RNA polymerase sigma-54 factor